LWFNEKIEGAYASVVLLDSNKKSLTENSPEVVADDPKSVVLNIPEIDTGKYTIQYRVMSIDGHVIESSLVFDIKNKITIINEKKEQCGDVHLLQQASHQ